MPKDRRCIYCEPDDNTNAKYQRSYPIRDDDGHSVSGTISGWVHEYRCPAHSTDNCNYSSPYRDPDRES